jgi:hypothetical protein
VAKPSKSPVDIIKDWNLSKTMIAERLGMNAYTLKMKLLGTDPRYHFTAQEMEALKMLLRELKKDIEGLD